MTTKDKTIFGAVVVVITLLIGWGVNNLHFGSQGATFGSVGNLLAENYINYVRQNGGYNSADPIQTSSTFTVSGGTSITGGLTVGSSGTSISGINYGSCYLMAGTTTGSRLITASSTREVDCQGLNPFVAGTVGSTPLTGVLLNDTIVLTQPTTTPAVNTFGTIQYVGAQASTTAGYIQVTLYNGTGADYTLATTTLANWRFIDLH